MALAPILAPILALILTLAPAGPGFAQDRGLAPFASAAELDAWIAAHASQDPPETGCPPDWDVCPGYEAEEEIIVTGSRGPAPTVTNNQQTGVDEGDIVKLWNDTLVILRRGRLFTVDISNGGLRPVHSVNAFPPGVEVDGDWYDEMLVADGWIVVIGYSYERETSEINRFRLDRRGRMTFVDSHRLTANDYYSSRNYSARLIGERLVLYSPMSVEDVDDPLADAPRLSRWRPDGREEPRSLLAVGDIHRAPSLIQGDPPAAELFHTITGCDLTALELACRAVSILGPAWRDVYVSPTAAYVWLTQEDHGGEGRLGSGVFRLPLDGGAPGMARAWGGPVDQLSFEEDAGAGVLNVLVTARSFGDGLWDAEFSGGAAALLRLPLDRFDDQAAPARMEDYRLLGPVPENGRRMQNRFVGGRLLYAVSNGWYDPETQSSLVTVVPVAGGPVTTWLLDGGVERIEPMGRDALIVSRTGEGVMFRSVNLAPNRPDQAADDALYVSDEYLLEDARGAETRSHAFFYQPDPTSPDGEFGLLGLPVIRELERDDALFDRAADLAFLRRGNDRLRMLGTLDSHPENQAEDHCEASCVDWYGDARPIFVNGRVFALLGYELVEGRESERTIREINRVSFAPRSMRRD